MSLLPTLQLAVISFETSQNFLLITVIRNLTRWQNLVNLSLKELTTVFKRPDPLQVETLSAMGTFRDSPSFG